MLHLALPTNRPNPAYKGKWTAPMIPNPAYKGPWAPRKIPNPDYYEDLHPANFNRIMGIGIEIWTVGQLVRGDSCGGSTKTTRHTHRCKLESCSTTSTWATHWRTHRR